MAQFLRPSSDLSINGWTGSSGGDLYQFIDESSASDADYIQWTIDNSGGIADNNAEFNLSSISTPAAGAGTLRVRAFLDTVEALVEDPTIQVALKEGGTTFFSSNQIVTVTATTYTFAISSALMAAVTDWGDLSLNISVVDGDDTRVMKVTWAELEAPNAATASGSFSLTDQSIGTVRIDLRDNPDVRNGSGMTREFQFRVKDDYSIGSTPFQYDSPSDAGDAASGQICSESGYWFPGRRVKWVNGRPYGDIFAPDEYERQKKGPNAWDFE